MHTRQSGAFQVFSCVVKKKKKKVCMTTRFFLGLLWAEQSRIFLLVLLFVLAHTLPPMLVWCTYIVFSVILCTLTLNANNSQPTVVAQPTLNANNSQPTVVAQPNVVVNKGNTSSSSSSSVVHV